MTDIIKKGRPTTGGKYSQYIPPVKLAYKVLGINAIPRGEGKVTVSARGLREIFALVLQNVTVDDEWYKETYLDVAAAIMSGDVAACREHFIRAGYFEGRQPCNHAFNENWYLGRYPDVAQACENGTVANAEEHFVHSGQQEGRAAIPEHDAAASEWIDLARTT
jgi:hypothetical protein